MRRARRLWRGIRRLPRGVKVCAAPLLVLLLAVSVNWLYQIARKPSELWFPLSGSLYKTPAQTWREYAPLFERYSTAAIPPALLAAIAQVEGSGNPIVRTYWRWSWTYRPFEWYRPASSSVGMFQITDGTFSEARRYCIQNHVVVESPSWSDVRPCGFSGLASRVVPADAIELTSAYLDRGVAGALGRHGVVRATPRHTQTLAALIHLCGSKAGDDYVRRGFRLLEQQRCGAHDARIYLARVGSMQSLFERLAAATPGT